MSAGEFMNDSGYSSSPNNQTRIAMVKRNIKETAVNMIPLAHGNPQRPKRKSSGQ